jgi:hypothetical protein
MEDCCVSPYELLGLIPNKCTIQDVRRAYRDLALLCHPDKGGDATDMRVIQAAYDWIMLQMNSMKEKETSFKAFLQSQVEYRPATFAEVIQNVSGFTEDLFENLYAKHAVPQDPLMKQFVKQYILNYVMYEFGKKNINANIEDVVAREMEAYFARAQEAEWSHASIPDGYGALMDVKHAEPFGKTEMMVYKEPLPLLSHLGESIHQQKQLEDYTYDAMCDYRAAYKDPAPPLPAEAPHPQTNIQDAFEALQLQRSLDDMKLVEPSVTLKFHPK